MADKRKPPEEAAGAGPRKRAAPTIDLTATEVPPPGAADEPAAAMGESEAPPPNGTSKEHWNWLKANIEGPAIAGGVAGAAIMVLVLFGLWLTGLVPIRYAGSTAMRARVTALEMELQDFKSRPAGAVDTKSVDALSGRMAKLEDSVSKIPAADSGLADRVAGAENAMKSLGLALAALNSRSDDNSANTALAAQRADAAEKAVAELRSSVQIASTASAGLSSADLDALQKRIAGLEQSAKSARDDIAKTAAADMPARLALSAAALRDLAFGGAPLASALAQAKSLGADEKLLAPLEPFAASGVPTQAALVQELRATLPAMVKLSGAAAPTGGFIERLQANAGNLVRVRPVDAPPGDDTSAVLARVEIEAAHGDIAAALGDLGKLPDAQRAPAQAWIKKANDRQAALAAARAFVTTAAAALGPKP
jgi:hypothetical protein